MKKRCGKGVPCGEACIERDKYCSLELGPRVSLGTSKLKSAIEEPKVKRDRGQSLDGEKVDFKKLDKRVNKWRKSLGLYSPDDVPPGHDESHVLLRDYMGKSSQQIAKLLGGAGKGPSVLEEIFVDIAERLSLFKDRDGRSNFISSDKLREEVARSIGLSNKLGFISENSPLIRSQDRSVNSILRVIKTMSAQSDFDQFMQTLKVVRRRAFANLDK